MFIVLMIDITEGTAPIYILVYGWKRPYFVF